MKTSSSLTVTLTASQARTLGRVASALGVDSSALLLGGSLAFLESLHETGDSDTSHALRDAVALASSGKAPAVTLAGLGLA